MGFKRYEIGQYIFNGVFGVTPLKITNWPISFEPIFTQSSVRTGCLVLRLKMYETRTVSAHPISIERTSSFFSSGGGKPFLPPGTVRYAVFLHRRPIWVDETEYFWLAAAVAATTFFGKY